MRARWPRTGRSIPQSVIYTLSPLTHNLGFGALVLTMHVGGEIVLHDLSRGASLLSRLRETGATFVFGVPAHAMDLLKEIEEAGARRSGSPAADFGFLARRCRRRWSRSCCPTASFRKAATA